MGCRPSYVKIIPKQTVGQISAKAKIYHRTNKVASDRSNNSIVETGNSKKTENQSGQSSDICSNTPNKNIQIELDEESQNNIVSVESPLQSSKRDESEIIESKHEDNQTTEIILENDVVKLRKKHKIPVWCVKCCQCKEPSLQSSKIDESEIVESKHEDNQTTEIILEKEVVKLRKKHKIWCVKCCQCHSNTTNSTKNSSIIIEMLKDFRYYFQHPYIRIFTAYGVVFVNFLFYAQDPTAHSFADNPLSFLGKNINFIFTKYPPGIASYIKTILWFWGFGFGIYLGDIIIHGFLFNRLFHLEMFSGGQGAWMLTFWCVLISLFGFAEVYNLILRIHGGYTAYLITSSINMTSGDFYTLTVAGTFMADYMTAFMVSDVILQEKLYPGLAKGLRRWWNAKYHRIYMFWFTFLITSPIAICLIYVSDHFFIWDKLNVDVSFNNELWRAFLCAAILIMDLVIVMQDWDFPHFVNPIKIKLPGVNVPQIKFYIPKINWIVYISGKWFNYSILLFVMVLDIHGWKDQIHYTPFHWAQYTHPRDGRIYNVNDRFSVHSHNETIISFAFRNSTINPSTGKLYIEGDTLLSARYEGYNSGLKAIAILPVFFTLVVFIVLIITYGRQPPPTVSNPYVGRAIMSTRTRQLAHTSSDHLFPNRRHNGTNKESSTGESDKLSMCSSLEEEGSLNQSDTASSCNGSIDSSVLQQDCGSVEFNQEVPKLDDSKQYRETEVSPPASVKRRGSKKFRNSVTTVQKRGSKSKEFRKTVVTLQKSLDKLP